MAQGVDPLASVGARLREAARVISDLEAEYERSLRAKAVSETVQLRVDAVVHNQRSSLDYLANRLVEAATGAAAKKVYWPMQQSEVEYEGKLEQNMPGLRGARPDVEAAVKAQQRWQSGMEWLGRLNALRNPGTHVDLLPQTRVENRRNEVTGPGGGGVSWGPGVTFGSGVSVMGAPMDPRTQRPAFLPRGVSYQETVYVDWLLPDGRSAGWARAACVGPRGSGWAQVAGVTPAMHCTSRQKINAASVSQPSSWLTTSPGGRRRRSAGFRRAP
jgi:hypothetical protein